MKRGDLRLSVLLMIVIMLCVSLAAGFSAGKLYTIENAQIWVTETDVYMDMDGQRYVYYLDYLEE